MNCVQLTGNLVRDLDLKRTPSGMSVTNGTIAVQRAIKSKNGPETDFVEFVAWQAHAEYLAKYAHKGDRLELIGRLESRKYIDKDNKSVTVWEVIVDNALALNRKDPEEKKEETKKEYIEGLPF